MIRTLLGNSRLRLYAPSYGSSSACRHYRVEIPLKIAAKLGLAEVLLENVHNLSDEDVDSYDIHLYYSLGDKRFIKQLKEYNRNRYQNSLLPRTPNTIYDIDDYVERVDIFNPKFVSLGSHDHTGRLLGPGDEIQVTYGNETFSLWKDKQIYPDGNKDITFDVMRNRRLIELIKQGARASSAVTTTCETLAQVHRNYGCKNVYVFPNSLLEEDYPHINIKKQKRITILWQGGYSHYIDFVFLKEALINVFTKRPNAQLLIWGWEYEGLTRALAPKNIQFIPWTEYSKFTLRLATLGHHINLCPLEETAFNTSKSAIKFYESSAITCPAATLAQNTGPYKEIIHGETGLLFNTPKEFEEMLIELIDDASLRNRLGGRAHEWVWANRNAVDTVKPLINFYQEIRHANNS